LHLSEKRRPTVTQIESLTLLLEGACARANAVKGSDSSAYEQCVADVREIITRLSEAVANEWSRVLLPNDQLN
jgi:hypothetical protein